VTVPRFRWSFPPGERDRQLDNQTVEKASLDGDEVPVFREVAVEEPPMEGLTDLVTESLARNGYETSLDHRRLEWSNWLRCESSFSVLLAPSKPGIFALGEEIMTPGEKRMLALFRIAEAEDLGMSLGRLFLPGHSERERLAAGNCFVRYAVIEDVAQRQAANAALQQWMAASCETASGVSGEFTTHTFPSTNSQSAKTQVGTGTEEAGPEEIVAGPQSGNSAA
jgi:hypothetical protein